MHPWFSMRKVIHNLHRIRWYEGFNVVSWICVYVVAILLIVTIRLRCLSMQISLVSIRRIMVTIFDTILQRVQPLGMTYKTTLSSRFPAMMIFIINTNAHLFLAFISSTIRRVVIVIFSFMATIGDWSFKSIVSWAAQCRLASLSWKTCLSNLWLNLLKDFLTKFLVYLTMIVALGSTQIMGIDDELEASN